jgi:hypothetical protein
MEYNIRPEETVIEAVIEAVSLCEDRSPKALPPITETVGADELNSIFDSVGDRPRSAPTARVTFEYTGHLVTVSADDTVVVDAAAGRTIPTER